MDIEVQSATPTTETATSEKSSEASKEVAKVKQQSVSADDSADETALESDTEELEADESQDADDESESDDQKDEDPRPKKKNGFKKRIDKLNQRVSEREQEIAYWKAEALKQKSQDNQPKEEPAKVIAETASKPLADNFDTHEEYVEALTDWKIEQREAQRSVKDREAQVKTEYQKAIDSHMSRIEEFKKSAPDFNDVLKEFDEDHAGFRFSAGLEESLITSDLGPAVIYELAKNPKELMRINALGVVAQAREIGKIEARLSRQEKPEPKKLTNAPAPLKPVGGKNAASSKSLNDMDPDEYMRERREQLKNSRR
jgi:hypothetical protein